MDRALSPMPPRGDMGIKPFRATHTRPHQLPHLRPNRLDPNGELPMTVDLVRIQRFLNHQLDWAELTRPERSAAVDELQRRGTTSDEARTHYGLNTHQYADMIRRHQQRRRNTQTPGPTKPGPPAPHLTNVPCEGDTRFTETPIRWDALPICNRCNQQTECLQITNPETSYFDGIAGGIAWANGKPAIQRKKAA